MTREEQIRLALKACCARYLPDKRPKQETEIDWTRTDETGAFLLRDKGLGTDYFASRLTAAVQGASSSQNPSALYARDDAQGGTSRTQGTSYPYYNVCNIDNRNIEKYLVDGRQNDMSSLGEDMSLAYASPVGGEQNQAEVPLAHPAVLSTQDMTCFPHVEDDGSDDYDDHWGDGADDELHRDPAAGQIVHSFLVNVWCGESRKGFSATRSTFFIWPTAQSLTRPELRFQRSVDFRSNPQRWFRDTKAQRRGIGEKWYKELCDWGKEQPRYDERVVGTLNRRTRFKGVKTEHYEAAGLDFMLPDPEICGRQAGVVHLRWRNWLYKLRLEAPSDIKEGGGRVLWLTGRWTPHVNRPTRI